ncbi:hypothetical protein [Ellagibacter isourolithinifaciens]|uniref:hypothetical protein n=1 Tax=Ellagibacter isourolithinifaciens TaxID=2137581 RepID=UPI003A8DBA15
MHQAPPRFWATRYRAWRRRGDARAHLHASPGCGGVVGGGVLDVLNRRDVSAVSDLVSAASVAMRPVVDATVGLSFGWFVAFGLIGAIGDVPGMTARDALLPAVCKKDGVDMRRFVGVSQSAESLVAVVGPSAAAERAVS